MFEAKILLDSISPMGARLTTFEVCFPRIVLAEFNTHRMFSRNSASSRAIPVKKMLERVQKTPFAPEVWGKNQKGMQAAEELTGAARDEADFTWRELRNHAVNTAHRLAVPPEEGGLDVHKQIANRLLEPWLWHTVIVTATEWKNFFALRDSKMAQPEIQRPASMMRKLYMKNTPQMLPAGAWHLPLVTGVDENTLLNETLGYTVEDLIKISCARCARVSYLTHDGVRDPKADLELYTSLVKNGHMSPLEHVAQSLDHQEWRRIAREQAHAWIEDRVPVGNLYGWLQHRKAVANEHEYPREDLFWNEAA